MNEPTFSPADVEELTGWHAQGQRDMRHKGYLENYGTLGDNGRWRYSKRDLIAFWIAGVLYERERRDLAQTLAQSWTMAEHVLARVEARPAPQFVVFGWKTERLAGGLTLSGTEFAYFNSLDDASRSGFVHLEVTDLKALAALASDRLIEALAKG